MTTTQTILVLLDKFHATTSVIAAELHQPVRIVQGFCEDAADAGMIEDQPINDTVPCWHITARGREELQRMLATKQNSSIAKS